MLLLEGDRVDFLYVLLDGQVELHGTGTMARRCWPFYAPSPPSFLPRSCSTPYALMSARTLLSAVKFWRIGSGDAIRTAMRLDPRFAVAVARDLAGCYRGLVRTVKNHKLRNSVERLANYLLALRAADNSGSVVRLHHEKRVLASLLGMTPENLSRAFSALQAYRANVQGAVVTLDKWRRWKRWRSLIRSSTTMRRAAARSWLRPGTRKSGPQNGTARLR